MALWVARLARQAMAGAAGTEVITPFFRAVQGMAFPVEVATAARVATPATVAMAVKAVSSTSTRRETSSTRAFLAYSRPTAGAAATGAAAAGAEVEVVQGENTVSVTKSN
jgi:hypothetical protein